MVVEKQENAWCVDELVVVLVLVVVELWVQVNVYELYDMYDMICLKSMLSYAIDFAMKMCGFVKTE